MVSIKTSLPTTTRLHAHTDIYILYACVCVGFIEISRQSSREGTDLEREKRCTFCTAPAGSMGYTVWLYHLQSAVCERQCTD